MKNNKKIQFLLLFFTMLIGFVFATTVNADVTKDGDVYHITTGQDLDMLLGLGNNSGYWNGTDNKTPTSIKISVDNDITLVKQQHEINSVFKDTIDIDFNDHMYYVTEQDNSSFKMDKSTLVDVFVRNLKSSESNVANTTGTLAGVPDPTDATKTVAGYLLSANSLFTGAGDQGTANGTVTYDNVLINYPNIHDGKSQMLTTGYVPIKFTGTNLLALGGQSGANFCRTTDLTVVDGDTTMTWGPGLGGNSTAMFNMRDGVGYPTSSVNFTVGSGATLTINNHVNAYTIVSGNSAGKIVNITNNGILTATIDGYATDSSSTFQAATSSFVSGGTGLTNTNITFGPNAVTTITSNTGLIQMDKVAILNIKAQSNSQTTLTSKNIRNAATARVFNGTATSGSSLTLDSVDSFSMRSVATAPLQQDNMRIVIANTPLTILGYAANNDTVTARYVAEIGSINGAWDGNGTPGDQMSPPLATNNSETKLKPAFGIRFEPGVLANSYTVNPSVWNYALSNPIFPADNTPVWLSHNGSGDNTQTFDIYDSRSQTASFRLQALVTGTGSRQYGFKKNGTSEVLSLNDQAQTILNASDFTAGTIGDAATAGHWTYTTDADHGLLVQAARSEKIGTYTGSVTYSLVDGLE